MGADAAEASERGWESGVVDTLVPMPKNAAISAVQQLPARGVELLVLALAVLVSPHLNGQTGVTYAVGSGAGGLVFDGTNIWVTGRSSVTKLLASTGATVGTYPVGSGAGGLVFDGTNIWVTTGFGGNRVTKLLASTGAILGVYPVGTSPAGIVFDGTNIWVVNYVSNTVTKLLASTGTLVGTYPVGVFPQALAFDGTNIWVANGGTNNTVTKLLASTGAVVDVLHVGSDPSGLVFDGTNIWVTNGESNTVMKLLASTGATLGTYPVGASPEGIAFDGTNIWVANGDSGTVTEVLAFTGATVGTYPVGDSPNSVLFDGTNIWVANVGSGTVTKISPAGFGNRPTISSNGIVPIGSAISIIQPGEWVSIYGNNLANGTTVWNGTFPASLGGTSVEINGKAAYLALVSPGQINLQAPDDTATGTVPVVVTTANGTAAATVTLAPFSPSFCLLDATHVAGIILRSDGSGAYGGGTYDILGPTGNSLGYPTVAARAGDRVELFGVGFGPTTPAVPAGQSFTGAAATTNAVQLSISVGSTPIFKTLIPSFAGLSSAGLYQINVTIPAGLGVGEASLEASVGSTTGHLTQSGVAISLR